MHAPDLLVRARVDDEHHQAEQLATQPGPHPVRAWNDEGPGHVSGRRIILVRAERLPIIGRGGVVVVVRKGVAEHRDEDEVLGDALVEHDVLVEEPRDVRDPAQIPRRVEGGKVMQVHNERAHHRQHEHRAVEVKHLAKALGDGVPVADVVLLEHRDAVRKLPAKQLPFGRVAVACHGFHVQDEVEQRVAGNEEVACEQIGLPEVPVQVAETSGRLEHVVLPVEVPGPLLLHLLLLLCIAEDLPLPLLGRLGQHLRRDGGQVEAADEQVHHPGQQRRHELVCEREARQAEPKVANDAYPPQPRLHHHGRARKREQLKSEHTHPAADAHQEHEHAMGRSVARAAIGTVEPLTVRLTDEDNEAA